jgi:hypothetical protein
VGLFTTNKTDSFQHVDLHRLWSNLFGAKSAAVYFVLCVESGHTKFPFSVEHVTLLTLAQARLSPCLGFAHAGLPLLTLNYQFRQAVAQPANYFNSSREGLELVLSKENQNVSHFRTNGIVYLS